MSMTSGIPAYAPRFNRTKPVVAIVAENSSTELTDYVIPYGVLAESGVAQVLAIATQAGPMQMLPALKLQPQATIAEFDSQFPEGADYVIVPAVIRRKDPTLLAWVNAQAKKGTTIVGVCDGVWVLANAGLLTGRKSVCHWFSYDSLKKKFPQTEWLQNTRYVSDGSIITTTGVTASIPVSVALVDAIAGHGKAALVAQAMGIQSWGTEHHSEQFKLSAKSIFTMVANGLSFWTREDIDIPITEGVDEVALSLVADAYSRTYRSKAFSLHTSDACVITRRGLMIVPDKIHGTNKTASRTIEVRSDLPPVASLDITLQEIETLYGTSTAEVTALQLEYPRP